MLCTRNYLETAASHLLRRDFKGLTPHIDLLVNIHTGNDEEDSRPPGSSWQQSAQSEDDGSLVLLNHLDSVEEGQGKCGDDEKEGYDGHEVAAETGSLVTGWTSNYYQSCQTGLIRPTGLKVFSIDWVSHKRWSLSSHEKWSLNTKFSISAL